MLNPDLEVEQSNDSPGTSPTLSSHRPSALALAPSSPCSCQDHGQGEQLCPQVYCWEPLARCPFLAQFQALPKPGQHLGTGSVCLTGLASSRAGVAWFGTQALILGTDPRLHLPRWLCLALSILTSDHLLGLQLRPPSSYCRGVLTR